MCVCSFVCTFVLCVYASLFGRVLKFIWATQVGKHLIQCWLLCLYGCVWVCVCVCVCVYVLVDVKNINNDSFHLVFIITNINQFMSNIMIIELQKKHFENWLYGK
jgi:hypothetical protein